MFETFQQFPIDDNKDAVEARQTGPRHAEAFAVRYGKRSHLIADGVEGYLLLALGRFGNLLINETLARGAGADPVDGDHWLPQWRAGRGPFFEDHGPGSYTLRFSDDLIGGRPGVTYVWSSKPKDYRQYVQVLGDGGRVLCSEVFEDYRRVIMLACRVEEAERRLLGFNRPETVHLNAA